MIPTITTFGWVPEFARGLVRDLRPRWAFEEVGQPYKVDLITSRSRRVPIIAASSRSARCPRIATMRSRSSNRAPWCCASPSAPAS